MIESKPSSTPVRRVSLAPTHPQHATEPTVPVGTNPWLILGVLCLGFFMILLDSTIVNVAIPSIVDSLQASLDQILWVLNAYVLVYAVLLITAGRLGDLLGPRNMFAAGLALFTIASAACAQAADTNYLILARAVQGVGGALLTPQTLTLLTTLFPPARRGMAFGIWGSVGGIAAVAGPTLGGYLVSTAGWRSIFYVNVPIGVVAVLAAIFLLPDIRPGRRHALDLGGVLLSGLGLLAIIFGLVEGEHFHWGAVWGFVSIPLIILGGVAFLALFALWERRQAEPLMPASLLRNRNFVLMNGVTFGFAFCILGLGLPLTLYLQSALGMSALQAGLTMAPMALASIFAAPLAGRRADRSGGKDVLILGLIAYIVGMIAVVWLATPGASSLTFTLPLLLAGIGLGGINAPATSLAMREVEPRLAGAASGLFNTVRQVGQVFGGAVVGAVLQNQLASALYQQAVTASAQLPDSVRAPFVAGFAAAGNGGLEVGRGETGVPLPAGIPADVAVQLQLAAQHVFTDAFVQALRPTLAVSIGALILALVACLAVRVRPVKQDSSERPALLDAA